MFWFERHPQFLWDIGAGDPDVTKPDAIRAEDRRKRDELEVDQTSPMRACSSPRLQVMSKRVPFLSCTEYRPEPAG